MKAKPSTRKNKKYYVEVGGKQVHFGSPDYKISPGTDRGDNYCARSSGISGANDPTSSNYWARRLWNCEGKKSVGKKSKLLN
jgi:hypothetical protein